MSWRHRSSPDPLRHGITPRPARGEYAAPVTMEDQRPDAELLAAHAAGDPSAFATLVHRHRDRLWAVALRTTGDPDEAADALQDALLKAHRSAASFRGDAQVTTWLHRIVVNACLDRMRRADRGRRCRCPSTTAPTRSSRAIRSDAASSPGRSTGRCARCRTSNEPRWSSSTSRGTRSTRPPSCSASRPGR